MSKKIKSLAALILIAAFVFSPLSFANFKLHGISAMGMERLVISDDTIWKKGEHIVDKFIYIENGATLRIEPGAVIKFSQAGDVYIPSINVLDGQIIAIGNETDKILFTKNSGDDQFAINIRNSGQNQQVSFFRYVIFEKGGYVNRVVDGGKKIFVNSALAFDGMPAFQFYSGKVHIENSVFRDNFFGAVDASIYEEPNEGGNYQNSSLEIVNSNFENSGNGVAVLSSINCQPFYFENEEGDEESTVSQCQPKVTLKNNWYDSELGPKQAPDDIFGGERLAGNYSLLGWRTKNLIADPLIVVPGITGSAKSMGEWKLDPILHTYDDLLDSLEDNGYEKNINLFEFPYDWKRSIKISALNLQSRIESILQDTNISKVDVVAHSMGGLVARTYVEEIEGTEYRGTIDQLITVGTPHNGSPEAYLKWEAGEGFFTMNDILGKHHFEQEAEEEGYNDDLKGYIQSKVTSVRELLPTGNYLYDVLKSETRQYSNGYPRNTFLEQLNNNDNMEKLSQVRFINIVGKLDYDSTIDKIRVVSSNVDGSWEHGMPENFYDKKTDRGLENGKGDETVPIESANSVESDEVIELEATHGDLPTKAQCDVFKKSTGANDCEYDEDAHIPNILLFNLFSPIDVQIISPGGARIGKDFVTGEIINEIEGAFYTGYDTKSEFVTIPNPEDGEYEILTQGTGEGEYHIEVVKISESEDGQTPLTESSVTLAGIAVPEKIQEQGVNVDGDQVLESRDTIAPAITISNPENKSYLNNQKLPIAFSVTDNISKPENIVIEKFLDGQKIGQTEIDLAMLNLGEHVLKIKATDEAGNVGEKEIKFSVSTSIQAIRNNIKKYYDLGLIKSKQQKNVLLVALEIMQERLEFLEMIQKNRFISNCAKNLIKMVVTEQIENHVDFLIKQIDRNSKSYDPKIRQLLVENLNWIKQDMSD